MVLKKLENIKNWRNFPMLVFQSVSNIFQYIYKLRMLGIYLNTLIKALDLRKSKAFLSVTFMSLSNPRLRKVTILLL